MYVFRCEDIILGCDDHHATYNASTCCNKYFNSKVYTLMGKCYSTHGNQIEQNFPGSTSGLQITARATNTRE